MPLTWNAILLGTGPDVDTVELTRKTESDFAGSTAGSASNPLSDRIHSFTVNDSDQDGVWDRDNNLLPENATLSKDGNDETVWLDSVIVYRATITYDDGTSATISAVTFQLTDGRVFLAPEYLDNADNAALNAKPLTSIRLDSVINNDTNLYVDRMAGDFVPCFTRGCRIETSRGPVAVEDLAIGDLVRTADHGLQPIRWIGGTSIPATGKFAPIEFAAGALGATSAFRVSPQHRMLITGAWAELYFTAPEVLVPAKALLNDRTIRRVPGGMVEYFHMLFDRHEIVFCDGVASESFHPGDFGLSAIANETRQEILEIFPELSGNPAVYGPTARMALRVREGAVLG